MDDNMTTDGGNKTFTSSFVANLSSPKPVFWLLIALISLVLPPLGVAIVLYLIVKVKSSQKKKIYILAAAAIALVSAGGAFIYFNAYSNWRYKTNYGYSYNTLDSYTLSSQLEGSVVSFKKPVEFKRVSSQVQVGSSVAGLAHLSNKTTPPSALGYITVSSRPSGLAGSESYVKSVNELLKARQGKEYDKFIAAFKDYLQKSLPFDLEVTVSQPASFTSTNVKNNAWQFEFSSTLKKDAKTRVSPIHGKLVFVIGKKTFYYLMVASIDRNWQSNQNTWNQVLDSIKIDQ